MIPVKDGIPLRRVPLGTLVLMLAGVIIYVVAITAGGTLLGGPSSETSLNWGAIPYEWAHYGQHCAIGLAGAGQAVLCTGQPDVGGTAGSQPPTWITAFSSMFIARDALQLVVSLALLGVFGAAVEDELGRVRFLALFVLGGLAWVVLAAAVGSGSAAPLLGNAGALAAVIGAYLALRRGEQIVSVRLVPLFFALSEAPAWAWAAGWVCFDALFGALGTFTVGGDAGATYYVHYACLAVGALAVLAVRSRSVAQTT